MKILSLTGFGRSTFQMNGLNVQVEIKSVNGKNLDLFLKSPQIYNELEMLVRSRVQELLIRGSVNVLITRQDTRVSQLQINKPFLERILNELNDVVPQTNNDKNYLLSALIRLPDAMQNNGAILDEVEKQGVLKALEEAASQLTSFRKQEGNSIEKDLLNSVKNIQTNLSEVKKVAPIRNHKQKDELLKKLDDLGIKEQLDKNRLEQELLYYIEKLDINEECVRLQNHCTYFEEIINNDDVAKGKKLGFIAQEMVREINTTGSKANDAIMQKLVVQMKEDAEKIKEQLLNVL
jgi:uncharacterized protein (TIGR00255 family)